MWWHTVTHGRGGGGHQNVFTGDAACGSIAGIQLAVYIIVSLIQGHTDIKFIEMYLWKFGWMVVTIKDRVASREICYTFSNKSLNVDRHHGKQTTNVWIIVTTLKPDIRIDSICKY